MSRPERLLLVSLLFVGAFACAKLPGEAVRDIDRTRLAYARAGDAGPVVVFENGLGNSMSVWSAVFTPASGFAQVVAYNRAGIGASRSGAARRDGPTIVRELRALLTELELPPPYILVGHSLGGQFVELFARTHPQEVAGVVFVDARHAEFGQRCLAAQAERCGQPWFADFLTPAGARQELVAARDTERAIREAGPFPAIPVRVLSGLGQPEDMPILRRTWAEAQSDLARLSPLGTQDTCEECGHYVQRDDPDRVIEAIRSIAE